MQKPIRRYPNAPDLARVFSARTAVSAATAQVLRTRSRAGGSRVVQGNDGVVCFPFFTGKGT
jgi:hypothetical protein